MGSNTCEYLQGFDSSQRLMAMLNKLGLTQIVPASLAEAVRVIRQDGAPVSGGDESDHVVGGIVRSD